jgi:hypothetical protein
VQLASKRPRTPLSQLLTLRAQVIWRRLSGDAASGPKNWRKVHKTLALLDFLVKHGAVGVIDEASSHAMTFAALQRFSAPRGGVASGAMAAGVPADAEEGCRLVREKAAALLSLLDDTDALRRCRAEAQRVAGRFVGLGRDSMGGREGGGRRSLAFGSGDDVAPASRGVTIATAGGSREALGAPRVRPFSLAGSSIAARALDESFEPYSPPSPTTDDAPKPAKLAPAIAPPTASAFGPWTSARFASTSALASSSAPVQLPPAQTDAFAELFAGAPRPCLFVMRCADAADARAGVELASPAPAESSAADNAGVSGGGSGGDPFASLLDAVDERMAATLAANNRGPNTEPLCAEAAITWNVNAGNTPQPYAPDIGAALASTAPAPAAGASSSGPGDAMDAFLFEESRRQLAAVQLHPAMWGPGSSLSPRQPPQLPVMAPVFRAAQPPEPNLIDL